MSDADAYNKRQFESGALTPAHLTRLVEAWQRNHGLTVDGFAGPNTIASLGPIAVDRIFPLVTLPDGRKPVITSGFYTENPSRPNHKGSDFFYKWLDSDPDVPVGDGGAVKRNGKRRWWYPPLDSFPLAGYALAAAAGEVAAAAQISTGWRVWIDHGDGLRTGYFHGARLTVEKDRLVAKGEPVLVVGHNPKAPDAKHLHFEVSPVERYAPTNPRLWLRGAGYLES
jgi:murein DD-endopeptidase MepM/ murein hydrolase activator NlpD